MKMAAKMAVARDRAVLAPLAPKTVPDAPAPKPAPASAPLPRWMRTRPTIANAENTCTTVKMIRHIGNPSLTRGSRQNRQELIRLERGSADQSSIDVRHREQLRRIACLDAAAIENARSGGNSSIPHLN